MIRTYDWWVVGYVLALHSPDASTFLKFKLACYVASSGVSYPADRRISDTSSGGKGTWSMRQCLFHSDLSSYRSHESGNPTSSTSSFPQSPGGARPPPFRLAFAIRTHLLGSTGLEILKALQATILWGGVEARIGRQKRVTLNMHLYENPSDALEGVINHANSANKQ